MNSSTPIERDATFSECGRYRYTLTRRWDRHKGLVGFIMLNPSTADDQADDPTIRRCIGFSRDWGYGGIVVTNIFSFRATSPRDLFQAAHPVCPFGEAARYADLLIDHSRSCSITIAAWGHHGKYLKRGEAVMRLFWARGLMLHCLGRTVSGRHPYHPLYLPASTVPIPFNFSVEEKPAMTGGAA